jgi:non-canonical purine NTP pyrophosphatase (RdgB/HAM1 family)
MTELTFITGNAGKAKYAALWLGYPLEHHALDLEEIQAVDVQKVVAHKTRQAFDILQKPVLVEDTSLEFDAMQGLPGPFIKWFGEKSLDLVGQMLNGFDTRAATARTCYGLCAGQEVKFFEGTMRGTIAEKPRGSRGFGWDSLFINDGYKVTRGEMDEKAYETTSYRKVALDMLAKYLENDNWAAELK